MNPLVLTLLFPLALVVLARAWGIYPRRLMVWLALVPAVFAAVSVAVGELLSFLVAVDMVVVAVDLLLLPALVALDVVLLVVFVIDLLTLPRRDAFDCQREMQRVASLKMPHQVRLVIGNRSRRLHEVWVRDDLPDECDAEPGHFRLRVPPLSRSTVHYRLEARRRGAFHLADGLRARGELAAILAAGLSICRRQPAARLSRHAANPRVRDAWPAPIG